MLQGRHHMHLMATLHKGWSLHKTRLGMPFNAAMQTLLGIFQEVSLCHRFLYNPDSTQTTHGAVHRSAYFSCTVQEDCSMVNLKGMKRAPDGRACPEVCDAAAAQPLHPFRRASVGRQIVCERQHQPYVMVLSACHHIVQPLHVSNLLGWHFAAKMAYSCKSGCNRRL